MVLHRLFHLVKKTLCTALVALMLAVPTIGFAQLVPVYAGNITLPFGHNQPGVDHLPELGLNTDGTGKGAEGFKEIINIVGSFLSLLMGSVALLALFAAGYQLVSAQNQASEQMEKQKMNVVYIMVGLVIFSLAGTIVNDFVFSNQGSYLRNPAEALNLADRTVNQIRQYLNLFLSFSGAGAILMLVIASLRLVINPGEDDQIEKQKKLVAYTATGIVIIGLSDTVVNRVIFPINRQTGALEGVNVPLLEIQLQGLSNYILGFLGVIIFVTFIIAGVVIAANFGNDDLVTKAKTAMRNVTIGALVSYSAYTVVATLLRTFLAAESGAQL